jgi:hypothetical protein
MTVEDDSEEIARTELGRPTAMYHPWNEFRAIYNVGFRDKVSSYAEAVEQHYQPTWRDDRAETKITT